MLLSLCMKSPQYQYPQPEDICYSGWTYTDPAESQSPVYIGVNSLSSQALLRFNGQIKLYMFKVYNDALCHTLDLGHPQRPMC